MPEARKLSPAAEAQADHDAASTGQMQVLWAALGNGADARLLNGKCQGKRVSELVLSATGRDYLGWLWRTGPAPLRKIIEGYFE